MKSNTFSVHFVVRNDRVDEEDYAPIYAKIVLNGKKLLITTNHKIHVDDWNVKKGAPLQKAKDFEIINGTIQAFKTRIYNAYSKLIASSAGLSIAGLKEAIIGKQNDQEKVHTLIETTIQHNENFEKLIGIKYSLGSYKNYKTSLKYYQEFVPQFYKKRDIPLAHVNYKFCEAFFLFLTTQKECKTNGANKQLQRLKTIMHYAINHGYINTNPIAMYKLQNTPVNKIALTMEELDRIGNLELNRPTLKHVRNIFYLQCYTGLSYADVKRLTMNDIQLDAKGDYWIKMERKKTLIAFSVPLLAPALLILKDYMNTKAPNEPLLSVLSNQKMNHNLKIIQELAGINKNLTTHLARHTFATTITLENGVPLETVSSMLGHSKLSTTQIYAKVLNKKIADDMSELKQKMRKLAS